MRRTEALQAEYGMLVRLFEGSLPARRLTTVPLRCTNCGTRQEWALAAINVDVTRALACCACGRLDLTAGYACCS